MYNLPPKSRQPLGQGTYGVVVAATVKSPGVTLQSGKKLETGFKVAIKTISQKTNANGEKMSTEEQGSLQTECEIGMMVRRVKESKDEEGRGIF